MIKSLRKEIKNLEALKESMEARKQIVASGEVKQKKNKKWWIFGNLRP